MHKYTHCLVALALGALLTHCSSDKTESTTRSSTKVKYNTTDFAGKTFTAFFSGAREAEAFKEARVKITFRKDNTGFMRVTDKSFFKDIPFNWAIEGDSMAIAPKDGLPQKSLIINEGGSYKLQEKDMAILLTD